MRMRSWVITICLAAASCSSDSPRKTLGDTCQSNADCETNRCDELLCKEQNPKETGESCSHDLECRSENCVSSEGGDICGPGLRADSEPCTDPNQCVSGWCTAGVCGGPPSNDGGMDAAADIGIPPPDMTPDAPPPSCPNPADELIDSLCYLKDAQCDLLTLCPIGYYCLGQRCICADLENCGMPCTKDAECAPAICGALGRCQLPIPCRSPWSCPAGRVCSGDNNTCIARGSGAEGAACATAADCQSGQCHTGRCLRSCSVNSDCPVAHRCVMLKPSFFKVCVAQTPCDSCDQASEYCYWTSCISGPCPGMKCATGARPCHSQSDCSYECTFELSSHEGQCNLGGSVNCAADEVVTQGLCQRAINCLLDSDCPVGHRCRRVPGFEDEPRFCERN